MRHHLRLSWVLVIYLSSSLTGCATMSSLDLKTSAWRKEALDHADRVQAGYQLKRYTCQRYADDTSAFIGQQQAWGVASVVVAAMLGVLSAAISNADDGNTWERNRKTFLLAGGAAFVPLAVNFLGNASAAAASGAKASVALAEPDDAKMWAGCEFARASYFDERGASIAATKAVMTAKEPEAAQEQATLTSALQQEATRQKHTAEAADAAAQAKAQLHSALVTKLEDAKKAGADPSALTPLQAEVAKAKSEADQAASVAKQANEASKQAETKASEAAEKNKSQR